MPNLYTSLLERMEGRQYSHYFSTFCPFDKHESPALLVFDDGLAKCLSCNKVWSHEYLDKKIGSHFIPRRIDTVSRVLPRWKRWEERYGDLEGIAEEAHRNVKRFPQFQTYFKKRKIYEYVESGMLGYLDGWVCFPVLSPSSDVIDIVVRSTSNNSSVRYVVSPISIGGNHPLYIPSWKQVLESDTVFVVFGIVDSISLYLAGVPSLTGTSGKSLNVELLKPLRKKFVIVPDAGEEREAHRLANALGWRARVKKLDYEDGCKDPDDIRKTFGNEYLLQALGA